MTSSYSEKITKLKNALENVFVKKTDIQNNLTSTDTNKPLSANQGKILDTNKVDKISGKSLSTNDFTNTYKTKLDNLDTLLESKASNTHTHGNITNDGKVGTNTYANKILVTGSGGVVTIASTISTLSILEAVAHTNIGTQASTTQAGINTAIDTAIGGLKTDKQDEITSIVLIPKTDDASGKIVFYTGDEPT